MFPQGAIDMLLQPPLSRGERWQEEGPHIVPEPPAYCSIEVHGIDNRLWTYIGFRTTRVGDEVVVPFGAGDHEVYGVVREVGTRRYRGPLAIKSVKRTIDKEEIERARAQARGTA